MKTVVLAFIFVVSAVSAATEIKLWNGDMPGSACEQVEVLKDAKQAVKIARENSKDWNIDAVKIGMLGFSAGGHLTAACSNSDVRPDFSVLVYPAYLFKKGGITLSEEISVNSDTPPTFIVQTKDDVKYYRSTLAYTAVLDAEAVDVESHLFAKGGHGYGLRNTEHPVSQWPMRCEA